MLTTRPPKARAPEARSCKELAVDEQPEKKFTPGAIAMLVVIPLALVIFGIDAIVLIRGDDADRAARAKAAATPAQTADAAPAPTDE